MADPGKGGRRYSRLSAAAICDPRLSGEVLRILAMLGVYANSDGLCFPAITSLAANLGVERRTVQRHLRRLEELGYVTTHKALRHTKGGWGRNRYLLAYPPITLKEGGADATPDVASPSQSDATPDVASTGPKKPQEKRVAMRRRKASDATPEGTSDATFESGRCDAGRRTISPMTINPVHQPNEDQPIVPRDADFDSKESRQAETEKAARDARQSERPALRPAHKFDATQRAVLAELNKLFCRLIDTADGGLVLEAYGAAERGEDWRQHLTPELLRMVGVPADA